MYVLIWVYFTNLSGAHKLHRAGVADMPSGVTSIPTVLKQHCVNWVCMLSEQIFEVDFTSINIKTPFSFRFLALLRPSRVRVGQVNTIARALEPTGKYGTCNRPSVFIRKQHYAPNCIVFTKIAFLCICIQRTICSLY